MEEDDEEYFINIKSFGINEIFFEESNFDSKDFTYIIYKINKIKRDSEKRRGEDWKFIFSDKW